MGKKLKIGLAALGVLLIGAAALLWRQSLPVRNAEKVLASLLNIPAEPILEAYEETFRKAETQLQASQENSEITEEPAVLPLEETYMRVAYAGMFGDLVSEEFLEDCIRMNEITSLHWGVMEQGMTARLEGLKLEKSGKRGLLYEADLLVQTETGEGQRFSVTGVVSIDESGKICAVTLRGRDLQRFLEGQMRDS